jgi:hypothetical protein
MSGDNLKAWDALAKPPISALKRIGGGRLTGKTDISPQWRYKAMTEQFGPCGVGWRFTVDRLWTEPGSDGEIFAFAQVGLRIHNCNGVPGWTEPIPGIGGSMLIHKEKGGLYNNDEAFKMATTDALGTAMKMLGVAAEIYLGNFDGSKYRETPEESAQRQKTEHTANAKANGNQALADKSMETLGKIMPQGTAALQEAWKVLSKEARQAVHDCCGEQWERLKAEAARAVA